MTETFASFIAARDAGDVLTGHVVSEMAFGVFVELAEGVHGLLAGAKLPEGTEVRVRILDIDVEKNRMSLTPA
ncbi:MAG: S1 RNA-binding domain-containing protein [Kibdelosporangium sp.]